MNSEEKLVGKYFHSFKDGDVSKLEWQGEITDYCGNGFYIVQTFEWGFGCDYVKKLVHISSMEGWNIYNDNEEMNEHYEYKYAKK